MNRRHLAFAFGFVFVELLIQIVGSLYYDQTPSAIWSFANGILLLAPLPCGMGTGLLCFLPAAVSELDWYSQLHILGPLLHVASFAVAVVALGFAGERLRQGTRTRRVVSSVLLFVLALVAEEALYYALRTLFLQRPMAWAKVFETAFSPAILPLVAILVVCCLQERRATRAARRLIALLTCSNLPNRALRVRPTRSVRENLEIRRAVRSKLHFERIKSS